MAAYLCDRKKKVWTVLRHDTFDSSIMAPKDPDAGLARVVLCLSMDSRVPCGFLMVEHANMTISSYGDTSKLLYDQQIMRKKLPGQDTYIRDEWGSICALNMFA